MDVALVMFFIMLAVGSIPLMVSLFATDEEPSSSELNLESEEDEEESEDEETDTDSTEEEEDSEEEEDRSDDSETEPSYEELTLPFRPIHTFTPDPEQWSDSYEIQNESPWPEISQDAQNAYEDHEDPHETSENIEEAVQWLTDSSTEAIHKEDDYENFMENIISFIKEPRAKGAQYIKEKPWRNRSPHLSRLIGERLLTMGLGLSSHGARFMGEHLEAFEALLEDTWCKDDLENPLLYQCIGRLGLLTPTKIERIQQDLMDQVEGRFPRERESTPQEEAHFNSLILVLCTSNKYPFPSGENGLSRLWHWDEHNPPLATWNHLLPVLYCLWVYYWTSQDTSGAANELGAMLGNWWDENGPSSEEINEQPGAWEGILMTTWALTPDQSMIWDQIQRRYEAIENKTAQIESMTDCYLDWFEEYSEQGEPPRESFNHKRFPPEEWIKPLPSTILNEAAQPSFKYPETWCEEMTKLEEPNVSRLRGPIS